MSYNYATAAALEVKEELEKVIKKQADQIERLQAQISILQKQIRSYKQAEKEEFENYG